jgi:hypothetical protein
VLGIIKLRGQKKEPKN